MQRIETCNELGCRQPGLIGTEPGERVPRHDASGFDASCIKTIRQKLGARIIVLGAQEARATELGGRHRSRVLIEEQHLGIYPSMKRSDVGHPTPFALLDEVINKLVDGSDMGIEPSAPLLGTEIGFTHPTMTASRLGAPGT